MEEKRERTRREKEVNSSPVLAVSMALALGGILPSCFRYPEHCGGFCMDGRPVNIPLLGLLWWCSCGDLVVFICGAHVMIWWCSCDDLVVVLT